jgi:hypothetical protein
MEKAITPIHELKGEAIPWEKVTPDEYPLIRAIAERADAIYRQWIAQRRLSLKPGQTLLEPDRIVIAMDIAAAHISRGLDLQGLLESDELSFISDIVSIQTNIQRLDGRLPNYVHLRFVQVQH